MKIEDDVLTVPRRKSNSPRLYRISSAYPRVVTCSPPDSGAARYQQFTSCLLEGLYGTFSSPRKIFPWIRITDQKTCLNVHNTPTTVSDIAWSHHPRRHRLTIYGDFQLSYRISLNVLVVVVHFGGDRQKCTPSVCLLARRPSVQGP